MYRYLYSLFLFSFLFALGCSGGSDIPVLPENTFNDMVLSDLSSNHSNRTLIGMWDTEFDLENMIVKLEPDREAGVHFNVTLLIPGPQIDIISFDGMTGIVEVDITIDNPSTINAYDIRFIVMTDSVGHLLLNPDNWTDLYDQPGGLPVNPFIAYAKDEPGRLFAGPSEHTERMEIYLPGLNPNVTFAIDASVPTNCLEPYWINDFFQEDPLTTDVGSYSQIDVEVYDWQEDAGPVYLYCPAVIGAGLWTLGPTGNPNTWGSTIYNNTGASAGEYQAFVLAYASDSPYQALYEEVHITVEEPPPPAPVYNWTRTWGGENYDYIEDVVITDSNEVLTCGTFRESVDFDPYGGGYILTSAGYEDAFFSKLNINGGLVWAKAWGGEDTDNADAMVLDSSSNHYFAGEFYGTADFDPNPAVIYNKNSNGAYDCYISKIDPWGSFLWVITWGGIKTDGIWDMTIDENDNLYVCGYFNDTVDFDPGSGSNVRTCTNEWYHDLFVCKFDTNGNLIWVNTCSGYEKEYAMALDVYNSSELFISGTFYGDCDFDPGTGIDNHYVSGYNALFISKWGTDGSYYWTNSMCNNVSTWDLIVDEVGDVFLPGSFEGENDFDPGSGEDNRTPIGSYDAFLTKHNNEGGYEWTRTWGCIGEWEYDSAWGVTIDPDGSIVVCGSFLLTCDFDPGPDTFNLSSSGNDDCYITAFNYEGDFLWAYAFGGSEGWDGARYLTAHGNNLYVTGVFEYSADFNPGPGTDVKTGHSYFDVFVSKYDYQ